VDGLAATQSNADSLAAQAATGDLKDVHDYMIASNEASLATEMVVTIKNKAVDAFIGDDKGAERCCDNTRRRTNRDADRE